MTFSYEAVILEWFSSFSFGLLTGKKVAIFSKIALEKFRVGGYQDIGKPDAVFIYLCNRSVPFGFATRYLSKQNCKIALISCASNLS